MGIELHDRIYVLIVLFVNYLFELCAHSFHLERIYKFINLVASIIEPLNNIESLFH